MTPEELEEEKLALKLCHTLDDSYSWSRYAFFQIYSCGRPVRYVAIYECKLLDGLKKTVRFEDRTGDTHVSYDYEPYGKPRVHLSDILEAAKLIRKKQGGSPEFC